MPSYALHIELVMSLDLLLLLRGYGDLAIAGCCRPLMILLVYLLSCLIPFFNAVCVLVEARKHGGNAHLI